jgi:hypothetical protein
MPFFTLHRNYTLRTTKGHTIQFVKGQEVWVPPACVPDAVSIGAVSSEQTDTLGDEVAPVVIMAPEEREKAIFAAFDTLLARQDRGDFTASGLPHVKKVWDICGFEVTNRERDAAWQTYSSLKAEQE